MYCDYVILLPMSTFQRKISPSLPPIIRVVCNVVVYVNRGVGLHYNVVALPIGIDNAVGHVREIAAVILVAIYFDRAAGELQSPIIDKFCRESHNQYFNLLMVRSKSDIVTTLVLALKTAIAWRIIFGDSFKYLR